MAEAAANGMRVMLVDDHPVVREIMSAVRSGSIGKGNSTNVLTLKKDFLLADIGSSVRVVGAFGVNRLPVLLDLSALMLQPQPVERS